MKKKFLFVVLLMIGILFAYLTTDKLELKISYSKIYLFDNGEPMMMKLSDDGFWRFHVKNDEIPSLLKKSILVFEDKYFYYHPGVNPFSIIRAVYENLKGNRIGASTITMQVARMFKPKKRTYINKLREILNAIQIEMNYSKDEILNFYFNKAPYGGNIEGLKAASYFYFGKKPQNLTISEIAILTTIPKNPNKNRPDKQKNLIKKRNIVLKRMFENHLITKEQFIRAKKEPIVSIKKNPAFNCPQYANRLKIDNETLYIKTSINEKLQNFIRELLKVEVKKRNSQGIFNGAAIVIDNKNMQIKSYVASNDFFDKKHGGENDGIMMKKSPGSTLKPFVYTLALDEGLITMQKRLLDMPLSYNGYVPKNYLKIYNGLITASEALKLSLNAPVVDIQNQLGKNSLYELLERAGIPLAFSKKRYGLSIALGGLDISLLDLTKLYTILANSGKLKNVSGESKNLLSPGATYLVSSVLSENYRNSLDGYWDSSPDIPRFAFKTGTSADAKHLYTIGYTPEYTIGVWFGNFDGNKPYVQLSGLKVVADVLSHIFKYINSNIKKNTWYNKPDSLTYKNVCTAYTNICNKNNLSSELVIKDVLIKCMKLNTQKINFLINLGEIGSIEDLIKNDCYKYLKYRPPEIISPANNEEFIFNRLIPKEFQVVKILCKSYSGENDVDIYLDSKPVKNNSFVQPGEGLHILQCIDKNGKADKTSFVLKNEY